MRCPLVVLATAVLLGVGINAVYDALRAAEADGRSRTEPVAIVLVLIAMNFPALFDGTLLRREPASGPRRSPRTGTMSPPRSDRPRRRHPRARDARVRLRVVPLGQHGRSDHSRASWTGRTWRASSSRGAAAATADLLNALDRRIQEGVARPGRVRGRRPSHGRGRRRAAQRHPVSERYNLVPPREVNRAFASVPGPRCGSRLRHAAVLHAHEARPSRRDRARRRRRTSRRSHRSSCIRSTIRCRSCAARRPRTR